jgi:membrane protein
MIALVVTHHCVQAFLRGQEAPSAEVISRELEIPSRLTRSILTELTGAKILSEVYVNERASIAYQPGIRVDDLTVANILARLERHGMDAVPIAESKHLEKLRDIAGRFEETIVKSPANVKIQDL